MNLVKKIELLNSIGLSCGPGPCPCRDQLAAQLSDDGARLIGKIVATKTIGRALLASALASISPDGPLSGTRDLYLRETEDSPACRSGAGH